MEEFNDLCERKNRKLEYPGIDTGNIQAIGKRTKRDARSGNLDNADQILNYFWTYFPVPLSKACTKLPWLENKVLIKFNDRHNIFKDAINLFERQVALLSLPKLYEHLRNGSPLFSAVTIDDNFYEDEEESIKKLNEFLDYQLGSDKEDFVNFLFDILNKNSGKRNCLNIVGAPSSGKTYFARIVKEALEVSGMIANMSNRSSFPLNNCVNKRVLHWDEPAFDPGSLETVKCLFSGDELSVAVKYQDNGSIMRTPIIATANSYVWPRDEAFNCRIQTYRFKSMPELKEWRNLHPLSLYLLFIQYKLM